MSLFFAFLAGVITVLSPCVLPLLPILLANSILEGRARPYGLILGFALFFTAITLALSLLVRQFQVPPDIHRTLAAIIFIVMGLILLVPRLKLAFEMALSRLTGRFGTAANSEGFWGGFASGMGLGLAWTPCVGPIMASVITLALNQQTTWSSSFTALAFSVGSALPMVLFVMGGARLQRRFGALKRHSARLQQGMGLLILLVGLAIWLGFDRHIQVLLLQAFPTWEATLTGWEGKVWK